MNAKKGSLLTEVLIALGLFSVLVVAFASVFLTSLSASLFASQEIQSQALLTESLEAARIVRQASWENLPTGTFYPKLENGNWNLIATASAETVGQLQRNLQISDCYRNEQGELVASGLLDSSTKKIEATVAWQGRVGRTVKAVTYLTRYLDNLIWKQTTKAEFDLGVMDSVETIDPPLQDGEFQLQGGCQGPVGANIFDDQFLNGWQIHPSAKSNLKIVNQSQGQVYQGENSLELSSFDGANTKLRNGDSICTLGFKRIEFYAYNSASIPQSFLIGGHWGQSFVEVALPPQSWQHVSLLYADVADGSEVNFDFIFLKAGNYQDTTKFYIDNLTLAGGVGGYYQLGLMTSSVFDTGRSVVFNRLEFDADIPLNTSVGFQVAASGSPTGPWSFTGPGGTDLENDLYTVASGQGLRFPGNVGRYVRYKAFLKSDDGHSTPVVREVRLNYSP